MGSRTRNRLIAALVAFASLGRAFAADLPADAEGAYQAARTGYYALKKDEGRRKFRHNWLPVIERFEAVAQRFPKSERAPDALFTAAQTLEELSRISRLDDDLSRAVADYQKLMDGHATHKLADDAGLQLARIQLDRLNHVEDARRTATHALELQPKGDRAAQLKALLASLPKDAHPVADSQKPALVAAIERLARSQAPLYEQKEEVKAEMDAPVQVPSEARAAKPAEKIRNLEAPVKLAAAEPSSPVEPVSAPVNADDEVELAAVKRSADVRTPSLSAADTAVAKARLKLAGRHDAEITLAEQLGLKVRRVIIDPGHGGHDSGAVGPSGTQEKDVALSISRKLAKELQREGLEVMLTRDDDTFVRLEDRANAANDARGDLFISVHCNSAPTKKLHGIEVYTLNTAADRYSIRLAARENASSEKSISDLQFILADLATKANTEESTNLATRVQKSLVTRLSSKYRQVRDLGPKQALFYVLLGTKMPAILVETSFLSNPEEEQRLASPEYQDQVAAAIAAGVQEFLGNRERVAKVD